MADQTTKKPPRMRTWVRVLLGVSLALNLAFVGVMAGAALRFGKPDGVNRPPPPIGALLFRELPREQRKMLRGRAFGNHKAHNRKRRAEAEQIDKALRNVPFDSKELEEVLSAHSQEREAFQSAVKQAWLGQVSQMTDDERADYADRLGHAARRHGKADKSDKGRD